MPTLAESRMPGSCDLIYDKKHFAALKPAQRSHATRGLFFPRKSEHYHNPSNWIRYAYNHSWGNQNILSYLKVIT